MSKENSYSHNSLPNRGNYPHTQMLSTNSGSSNTSVDKMEGILELLDQTCAKFKDQTAIEWRDQKLSYGTLDVKANRLASCLIANDLSNGSVVAALVEDRIEIIAVLIGILRAGCVFVPLDPDSPEKRLCEIASDLSPDCFIIEPQHCEVLRNICSGSQKATKVIVLGEYFKPGKFDQNLVPVSGLLEDFSTQRPSASVNPENMCYIYYTSGSTGKPKGIAGRLKGLTHFVQWEIDRFNIAAGCRISQFTAPTFDPFFRDLFVPLCVGGTVCIPPDRPAIFDPALLVEWIDSQRINLIHCVPSLFRSIVGKIPDSHRFMALQYVLLAGEVLHVSDVKRWFGIFGSRIQLVNVYGPTEATLAKFYYVIQESDINRNFIPIGKPIPGVKALVLNQYGGMCPLGVVGELYIRTPYLTLGYYNNPKSTAEVFIQNPFSDEPKDIVYKTGDLVRVLSDGNFQFTGRNDNQVKIRGIRIELGEIESKLQEHEFVKAAVVLAREETPGENRLVGYIVADGQQPPKASELRSFLIKKLPEYMIPSAFIVIDRLPLTTTGKVDRLALSTMEGILPALEKEYVEATTNVEKRLVKIWKDVLSVDPIGIHDNFFALGGHSLLVIRVISRIRDSFGIELNVRVLFEQPTIAGLASLIRAETGG